MGENLSIHGRAIVPLVALEGARESGNIVGVTNGRKQRVFFNFLPLFTQVLFALLTKNLKIVAGCGFGGSGVVVREGLKTGIKIGSSELSTMETMLKLFLEKHNLIERVRWFISKSLRRL